MNSTWTSRLLQKASQKSSTPETALHEACYSGCSLQMMNQILQIHPEAIYKRDASGRTPLHWALSTKTQHAKAWDILEFIKTTMILENNKNENVHDDYIPKGGVIIAEEYEKLFLQRSDLGYTPLDHACCSDASTDIIALLLDLCPESARRCKSGSTPLHMFVEYARSKHMKMNVGSMEALIHSYPEAVKMVDKRGNTPLHYACYPDANIEAFQLLLQTNHNTTSSRNILGQTPLHTACIQGTSLPIINLLLYTNPQCAMYRDYEGNTPLHLACLNNINPIVKCRLVENGSFVSGFSILGLENGFGRTPLELCRDIGDIFSLVRLIPHFFQRQ